MLQELNIQLVFLAVFLAFWLGSLVGQVGYVLAHRQPESFRKVSPSLPPDEARWREYLKPKQKY